MVGGYGTVVFLDPEGKLLGHSFADGPWVNSLLAVSAQNGNDIWARTGWNHGIMVYEGSPGFLPGGGSITFGNVRQPMFRTCCKVIPFVNGKTLLFEEYLSRKHTGERVIVAAAEEGFGVLSVDKREWLWKIEGGTPVTACLVDGQEAVIIGGADGFIAAFGLYNGQPLRRQYCGAPITGLCWLKEAAVLAVGTRKGLLALNTAWETQSFLAREIVRMVQVDDQTICIGGKSGQMLITKW